MKKFCLSLFMAVNALAASALDFTVAGVSYTSTSDVAPYTAKVVAGTYSGDVVIPEQVEYRGTTYDITAIDDKAFQSSTVTSVLLPQSIETIGTYAFADCSQLTSVNIPSKVTVINDYTFYNCTALEEFVIPANVTQVGTNECCYAFRGCTALQKLTIEDSDSPLTLNYSYSQYQNTGNGWNYCYYGIFNYLNIEELYLGREVSYGWGTYKNAPFSDLSKLQKLTIGPKVKTIGNGLFSRCGLEFLKIPNGITSIGSSAFSGSPNLKTLWLGAEVLSVGEYAFASCPKLVKRFLLPNTVPTGIYRAFSNVTGAQVIVANENYGEEGKTVCGGTIHIYPLVSSNFTVDGITYVPTSFSSRSCDVFDCTYDPSVTTVNIGRTVEYQGVTMNVDIINDWAVGYNDYITDVTIDNNGAINPYAFAHCSKLHTLTVTNGDVIAANAFRNSFTACEGGSKASIANDGAIGASAFTECTNLQAADISNNGIIDNKAFSACSGMKIVNINNTDLIEDNAFSACASLTTANVNNIGSVGASAFSDCAGLKALTVGPTVTDLKDYCFANSFTNSEDGEATLNNQGTLGANCFYDATKLAKALLCEEITSLGNSVFQKCESLSQVNIPKCITEIPKYAFDGCSSLQHIGLPEGLLTIDDNAFSKSGLVELTIPAATETINNFAFNGCTALDNLRFDDSRNSITLGYNEDRQNYGKGLFYDCSLENVYVGRDLSYKTGSGYGYSPFAKGQIKNIVFGEQYPTEVQANMFHQCAKLKTAHLGENQQTIGEYAFYNCEALTSVNVPEGNLNIEQYTFNGCGSLQRIALPESLVKIKQYAFGRSGLVELAIPAATAEIENGVFNQTTNLALFVMKDGDQELKLGINGTNAGLFHDCHLNKVVQGRNISYPSTPGNGYSPFYRNTYLTTVEVTDIPEQILENQFYGCTALTDVTIGDGVTAIQNYAFSGCTKLTNFLFGESVATIGEEAFSDCTAMVHLYAEAVTPPVCGFQALDDIVKWTCTLHVPAGTMDDYAAAPQWKEFLKFAATEVTTGDANADGRISVADVSTIVDYVLGNEPKHIDMTAADANEDGSVLISDATTVVDMILTPMATAATANIMQLNALNGATPTLLTASAETSTMHLTPAGGIKAVAAQFDVVMPEGVSVKRVSASGTHTVATREIADGVVRMVIMSATNSEIPADLLADVEFEGTDDERTEIKVDNIYIVKPDLSEVVSLPVNIALNAETTAVDNIHGAGNLSVRGGHRSIEVVSPAATEVTLSTIGGATRRIRVSAGRTVISVSMPGVYVINNVKVVVR